MEIRVIKDHKKRFMELLLLADEQENMIDNYLERGKMFALYEDDLKAICIVTDEGNGICELKNIVTVPDYQGLGYGGKLVDHVFNEYKKTYSQMIVGTGDSLLTLSFYKKCGFKETHRIKNFFTDHYDHPIFEAGKQLVDMIYLKRE